MHKSIEKLAYKITEAVQGDLLADITDKVNIYHRKVTAHTSADLAYANGVVASGLRAASLISEAKNAGNYNSFLSSLRQHLPVVVNIDTPGSSLRAYDTTQCFIFIATSAREHVALNILAHKVAELSLVPGFVVANYAADENRVELPADELLKKYLGNPDDQIECPTPSQKIIFGNRRRRIPNWFNLDLPVMSGTNKDDQARSFEIMASEKYFTDHLQDIITRAISEYKAVFGVDFSMVEVLGKKSSEAILSHNAMVFKAFDASAKHQPLLVKINQLKPFPADQLREDLQKTKSITLLENTELGGAASPAFQNLQNLFPSHILYAGRLGGSLSEDSIRDIISHMQENKSPQEYFVEMQFSKEHSPYPKHEILLQEINKQYPDLKNESVGKAAKSANGAGAPVDIPNSVREHTDKGPNYSRLSGFYDNVAFFYQQDEKDELVADPFAALPVTPAGSAGFFNTGVGRTAIPHFRPNRCTGCGDCFVQCPHAALPPSVAGVEQLMRTGMDLASAKGHKLLKLTPMLKNLAKLAGKSVNENTEKLEDFLPEAFNNLCTQMKLEGENLEAAQNEFNLVINELGSLPVAITETFYRGPEKSEKGTGELFSINFNPSTCTGCGICSQACPEEAINMVEEDQELVTEAREALRLWEALPSVDSITLATLRETADYNQLATILLPKENYSTMIGASPSESFNAYKTLVHLATSTVNGIVSPKRRDLINNVNSLIDSISNNIHESLSDTLPRENLDALAVTLKETRSQKATIHEIVDRLEELGQKKMVDTRALQRKTDLVDALKELQWVLTSGPTGVGRSTFALFLSGSDKMAWAQQYPLNNFTAPTMVQWHSSAPEQVLGLINGHIRHQVDNLKLIRRAEMEAAGKYDPAAHDLEIASLDWDKLTTEERNSIPPVLVIGERDDINSSGWQGLNKLLGSDLPVKIILLDNIAPPSKNAITNLAQSYTGLLNAIVMKKAFVFQGTISDPDNLATGLMDGLSGSKPALLNLFAFNEEAHNAETTEALPYASLAVNSRSFPLVYFNPVKEHGFLNGAIDLDANRENRQDWVTEEIPLPTEETLAYSCRLC